MGWGKKSVSPSQFLFVTVSFFTSYIEADLGGGGECLDLYVPNKIWILLKSFSSQSASLEIAFFVCVCIFTLQEPLL